MRADEGGGPWGVLLDEEVGAGHGEEVYACPLGLGREHAAGQVGAVGAHDRDVGGERRQVLERRRCAVGPGAALEEPRLHFGRARELDLAVAFQDSAVAREEPPGVERRELLRERFMVALPPGHRLAARREVALAELRDDGKTFRGSLEVMSVVKYKRTSVRFVLKIEDRPDWMEVSMLNRLERKLRSELGSPSPEPTDPKTPPSKDSPQKDPPKPDEGGPPISKTP